MPEQIYNANYHPEKLIEIMSEGRSKAQACSDFGISLSTHEKWVKTHPEYCAAYALAKTHAQAWWEEQLRNGTIGKIPYFNAKSIEFSMRARFPDDYREKPPDPAINNIFLSISDEQLEKLAIEKAKRLGLMDEMSGSVIEGEVEKVESQPKD